MSGGRVGALVGHDNGRRGTVVADDAREFLAGRVRALGWLSDPDVAVVLSRACALIMPSRSDGFGLPLLEAMSLRVPVVASAAPALVEVAAGAAVHHPVDDPQALAAALRSVLDDSRLSDALRDRGMRRAAAFSWTEAARRTWELYRSLL